MCFNSFNTHNNSTRGVLVLCSLYRWEVEAQRGSVTVPKVAQQAAEPKFKLVNLSPELHLHKDHQAGSAVTSHWTKVQSQIAIHLGLRACDSPHLSCVKHCGAAWLVQKLVPTLQCPLFYSPPGHSFQGPISLNITQISPLSMNFSIPYISRMSHLYHIFPSFCLLLQLCIFIAPHLL